MKIDEVIPSTNFEDNYERAVVNIHYTYGWLKNIFRGELKRFDLTIKQFDILNILRGQYPKPATVHLIKELIPDKRSDVPPIIDRLIQKGLVSRSTYRNDHRSVDIRISDRGMEILTHVDVEFKTRDFISGNLSEKEVENLNSLLDKVRG